MCFILCVRVRASDKHKTDVYNYNIYDECICIFDVCMFSRVLLVCMDGRGVT